MHPDAAQVGHGRTSAAVSPGDAEGLSVPMWSVRDPTPGKGGRSCTVRDLDPRDHPHRPTRPGASAVTIMTLSVIVLRMLLRLAAGRPALPSATVLDSRTYDRAQKVAPVPAMTGPNGNETVRLSVCFLPLHGLPCQGTLDLPQGCPSNFLRFC
jgi:hypothetical protein